MSGVFVLDLMSYIIYIRSYNWSGPSRGRTEQIDAPAFPVVMSRISLGGDAPCGM